ncbi:glycoside hydrolase family 43 protein [Sunxiuqinia sp. A32]|uniref:glycoside hydrolase family 43 protein n=1 Tax=Sunxiuqinia sp. A32 TaxID=3461496 RepID=UPI0040459FE4
MKYFRILLLIMIASLQGIQSNAEGTIPKNENQASITQEIENSDNVWMLTYFRQRYPTRIEIDADGNTIEVPLPDPMQVEQLHVALSTDGRNWTPINNNEPIWEQRMRDPFVRRGADGTWRLLATGGKRNKDGENLGPHCLFATSTDLVNWEVEKYLPLMKDVRNESGMMARNIWAPEWFYDDTTGEYVLIWSSSFEDAGWKKSRLWYCKTKDWEHFTPAKEFFAPPYSVIDGTLIKQDGIYYLFHKEEEFGAKTGERRAIRVATSKNLDGPYEIVEGPLNDGQIVPIITEGPSVMKDPVHDGWLLFYDYCMTNRYGISFSPDLIHWSIVDDVTLPADARHGCVSKLTKEEVKNLTTKFPSGE